jgi:heterogeneous nuclear ribonucleoprotein A1/A3
MKQPLFGFVLAAALCAGLASDARAQFSMAIGNPYAGSSLVVGSGYGLGYGVPYGYGLGYGVSPYLGYGVDSFGYSSGYSGLGVPYGGYGFTYPAYGVYSVRPGFGYGYGFRGPVRPYGFGYGFRGPGFYGGRRWYR